MQRRLMASRVPLKNCQQALLAGVRPPPDFCSLGGEKSSGILLRPRFFCPDYQWPQMATKLSPNGGVRFVLMIFEREARRFELGVERFELDLRSKQLGSRSLHLKRTALPPPTARQSLAWPASIRRAPSALGRGQSRVSCDEDRSRIEGPKALSGPSASLPDAPENTPATRIPTPAGLRHA